MKNFLKTIIVVFAVISIVFAVAGCSGEEAPPPDVSLSDLYGTWVFEKDNGDTITYIFSKNMNYSCVQDLREGKTNIYGSYSLDGNSLTLKPKDVYGSSVHEITSFDGENMVWGKPPVQSTFKKTKK